MREETGRERLNRKELRTPRRPSNKGRFSGGLKTEKEEQFCLIGTEEIAFTPGELFRNGMEPNPQPVTDRCESLRAEGEKRFAGKRKSVSGGSKGLRSRKPCHPLNIAARGKQKETNPRHVLKFQKGVNKLGIVRG